MQIKSTLRSSLPKILFGAGAAADPVVTRRELASPGAPFGAPIDTFDSSPTTESEAPKQAASLPVLDVSVDISQLDPRTQAALRSLVTAADKIDRLYTKMKEPGAILPLDAPSPDAPDAEKEAYKNQLKTWFDAHPESGSDWESMFTVIRRQGGGFVAIPYAKAFERESKEIAAHLRQAAETIPDQKVANYLRVTADSYLNGDHGAALEAWKALDGTTSIEVSAGMTEWMPNTFFDKGAPTLFMGVPNASTRDLLANLSSRQAELDAALPRGPGFESWPMQEGHPLVMFDAFYITPQDPLWEGWAYAPPDGGATVKGDFAGNLFGAKADMLMKPATRELLQPQFAQHVSAESANQILALHEFSHGLGPSTSLVNGKEVDFSEAIGDSRRYSALEEGKADMMAALLADQLFEEGGLPASDRDSFNSTMVAQLLRRARNRNDGGNPGAPGAIHSLNHLINSGALVPDATGKYAIDAEQMKRSVRELVASYLKGERTADVAMADAILAEKPVPGLQRAMDALDAMGAPVDNLARFDIKERLGMRE